MRKEHCRERSPAASGTTSRVDWRRSGGNAGTNLRCRNLPSQNGRAGQAPNLRRQSRRSALTRSRMPKATASRTRTSAQESEPRLLITRSVPQDRPGPTYPATVGRRRRSRRGIRNRRQRRSNRSRRLGRRAASRAKTRAAPPTSTPAPTDRSCPG